MTFSLRTESRGMFSVHQASPELTKPLTLKKMPTNDLVLLPYSALPDSVLKRIE